MAGLKCPNDHCNAPEMGCNLGFLQLNECENWQKLEQSSETEQRINPALGKTALVPWSSTGFGLADVPLIAETERPHVIGLIGSYNAGKTTMLSALYLLLSHGYAFGSQRFAGSYTLSAWENIAGPLRWKAGEAPSFPFHTPISPDRHPALLHLALGNKAQHVKRNILLTDAPGEWFKAWSINADDVAASGARWIAKNADLFVLAVDSAAIADVTTRGRARAEIDQLALRLASIREDRPVLCVWTKADVEVPQAIKLGINGQLTSLFPEIEPQDFSVLVSGAEPARLQNLLSFFNMLLKSADYIRSVKVGAPHINSKDFFLSLGQHI